MNEVRKREDSNPNNKSLHILENYQAKENLNTSFDNSNNINKSFGNNYTNNNSE